MTHLILIPTYKPDQSLFKLIDEYLINNKTEVLVINNGNNKEYDNFFDQISKKEKCTVTKVNRNFGKGFGIKKGLEFVLNNYINIGYVIFADDDGQHTPKDFKIFLKKINNIDDNYFLIGKRQHNLKTPIKNFLGNKIYNKILKYKYDFNISDALCGLRALHIKNAEILLKIQNNEFEFEVETIREMYKYKKIHIKEIEVSSTYISNNKSNFSPILDSFKLIKYIYNIKKQK